MGSAPGSEYMCEAAAVITCPTTEISAAFEGDNTPPANVQNDTTSTTDHLDRSAVAAASSPCSKLLGNPPNVPQTPVTKYELVESVDFPGRTSNMPCERCKCFTVDYFSQAQLSYYLEDTLPDMPKLRSSSENGCGLCGDLMKFITSKIDGSDHSTPGGNYLNIEVRAEVVDKRFCSPAFNIDFIVCFKSKTGRINYGVVYSLYSPSTISTAVRIPRLPSSSTLSPENISLIRSWIKDCEANHVNCPNDSNVWLPTRVINVSTPMPILAEVTDKMGRYTTLTYCWGISRENPVEEQYVTKSETLKSRMRGMPLDEMPQTFQDAVMATRILGIQYLWIDALCIIQDDFEDKKKEIPKMSSIYKNATIALSAIQAANSRTGFLSRGALPPPTVIMPYLYSQAYPSYYYMYAVRDEKIMSRITDQWEYDVDISQWNERAWTFQERLISRRILHFTNKALFFECQTSNISENDKSHGAYMSTRSSRNKREFGTLERLPDPSLVDKRKVLGTYYDLVSQYSGRLLSYQDDREDAFSAVIALFKEVLPFQYTAGLWMCDITQGLLWERSKHIQHSGTTIPCQKMWPSWSWLSVVGEVFWIFGKANRPQLQGFGSSDQTPSYEPPGDGTPAKLHVPAVMLNIDQYIIDTRSLHNSRAVRIELQGHTFGYGDLDDYSIEPASMLMCCIGKETEYVKYKGLAIGGLLVEPVVGENNCFRRVGVFESSGQPKWQLNMQDNDVEYEGLDEDATRLGRKHYERFSDFIFGRPVASITLV